MTDVYEYEMVSDKVTVHWFSITK